MQGRVPGDRRFIAHPSRRRHRRGSAIAARLAYDGDLLTVERNADAQGRVIEKLQHEYEEAQRKLGVTRAERQAGILSEISEREAMLDQVASELSKSDKRLADSRIRSPIDGQVQKMFVTAVGASVEATERIAVVVPTQAAMVVEAHVSSADRGPLRPGQRVDIKFDAYPFQKYGKVPGTLTWLSPDAEEPADRAGGSAVRAMYRARISLTQIPANFELIPGMLLGTGASGAIDAPKTEPACPEPGRSVKAVVGVGWLIANAVTKTHSSRCASG